MLMTLLKNEILKIKKSNIEWIITISFILSISVGFLPIFGDSKDSSIGTVVQMIFAHSSLFLPLLTGIIATMLCNFEHQNNGWLKYASMPLNRVHIYLSKLVLLNILVLLVQLTFLLSIVFVLGIKGYLFNIPFQAYLLSCLLGWLSCIPLGALQLGLAIYFKSFFTPTMINVFLTFPALLISNTNFLSLIYPWSQPTLSMLQAFVGTLGGDSGFLEKPYLFVSVLIIMGILFISSSLYYVRRKEY